MRLSRFCKWTPHLILEKNADLLFISETWLPIDDSVFTNDMLPNGDDMLSQPRLSRSGGGVAIIYRASSKVIPTPILSCSTFEVCCLKIVTPSNSLLCSCIFRPCASKKNNTNFSNFISDFNNFLELFAPNDNIYIFGDFNIHFEKSDDPSTRKFKDLLDELNLQQTIAVPTHKAGHTLDLLLMRDSLSESPVPSVLDMALSDHFLIQFNLPYHRTKPETKVINTRNIKSIDIDVFKSDLAHKLSECDKSSFYVFSCCIKETLDKFASLKKELSLVALLPPGSIFLSKLKSRSKDKQNDFTGKQDLLHIRIYSNFRKIKPSM